MGEIISKILILTFFSQLISLPVFGVVLSHMVAPTPLPAVEVAPTTPEVGQVKVLLVPGHDDVAWGAQYGGVKEAKMNLAVAKRINAILAKDPRFQVWVTRDDQGYTKEFSDYLTTQRESIINFREDSKKLFSKLTEGGLFLERESVPHNTAPEEASIVLYGINKWANENKMDAVIHIHFNDDFRPSIWTIGKNSGFAVYLPDAQMVNALPSGQLAVSIFNELQKKYRTSTYEKELGGLVASQKLIALGSNLTLIESVRAVLIEYGYIYEKRLRNYATRHAAYDEMSRLTAEGIKKYFFQ